MAEVHSNVAIRQLAVAGGAAGNRTVAGIKVGDVIKSVQYINFTLTEGTPNTKAFVVADLTSEFSITANNTINNTGGTASTGGILIVLWVSAHASGGGLNRGD